MYNRILIFVGYLYRLPIIVNRSLDSRPPTRGE